ncbi:hypothetical protein OC846_003096 [Tilletia horrida]|uniref:Myb-like domain-containing protein n=1 Tax=Tilletia horrida TaxID=155126 RepID=A0AAN6GQ31_9BASI|nr:hypothetical protein OC846_003096 [Tilletia horrida]
MLNDKELAHRFTERTAGDLKDRFRTYFPDTYHEVYPNAKTHHSHRVRGKDSAGHSIFQKVKPNQRRPFTPAEDEAIKRGYDQHGSHWSIIARDPVFGGQRRATDLRDRFRNAFPAEYERAGYKPRPKPKRERRPSANNLPEAAGSTLPPGFDTWTAALTSNIPVGSSAALNGLQRSFSSKRATPKVSNFDLTPSSESGDHTEVGHSAFGGALARSFSGTLPTDSDHSANMSLANSPTAGDAVAVDPTALATSVNPNSAAMVLPQPGMMPRAQSAAEGFLPRAQSAVDGTSPFRPTMWSSAMDGFLDPVQDLLDPVAPTSSMWNPFLSTSSWNGTPSLSTSVAPSHHPFAGDLHHHSVTNFSIDDLPKFIDMGSMQQLPPLLSNWLDGTNTGLGNMASAAAMVAPAGPSSLNDAVFTGGPASSVPSHPGRSASDSHTMTLSSAPSISDAAVAATVASDHTMGSTEMLDRRPSSADGAQQAFAHFSSMHSAPSMATAFNTGSPTASPFW